ncbi:MAG: dehydrogenase/reductase SDR family protein 7B [Limisphaerales bacterium]|jgi:dehydrogenase/reductase SDR family protein 7B
MQNLKGKTVIITGASSGIGAACAIDCGKQGANVVLVARDIPRMEKVQQAIGGKSICIQADVSNETDCQKIISQTVEEFGGIDVLINNAGISMRALFNEAELDVIRKLMDINFWGSVYCTKFALPYLLKSKGSIVGVSSIAGYRGLPGRTGYSASKFAMQGFFEALRTEHLHDGLHILVACPGFTATNIRSTSLNAAGQNQGDSPRDESAMMSAEQVAVHIRTGIEKRKRTIVLTNQGKLTVFLNKWLPGFMDNQVYNHFANEPDSPFTKK